MTMPEVKPVAEVKVKTVAEVLLDFWKRLYLRWALRPAGGTRYRGSAHPKGNRNPGVCRAMRKTHRPRRPGRPICKYAA